MEQLKAPKGANRKKRPVGRGAACGRGGTSGKGHDGQNSRSGGGVRVGFEGGQMPLFRRIATRGFSNHPFKKEYTVVNLKTIEERYENGETVNLESLRGKGIVKNKKAIVKVLGSGDLSKKLTFAVDKISASAREKIEKVGGTIEGKEEGNNG
jgi:large subunit ribosomal protein L15